MKDRALTPETVEILDALGIWDELKVPTLHPIAVEIMEQRSPMMMRVRQDLEVLSQGGWFPHAIECSFNVFSQLKEEADNQSRTEDLIRQAISEAEERSEAHDAYATLNNPLYVEIEASIYLSGNEIWYVGGKIPHFTNWRSLRTTIDALYIMCHSQNHPHEQQEFKE